MFSSESIHGFGGIFFGMTPDEVAEYGSFEPADDKGWSKSLDLVVVLGRGYNQYLKFEDKMLVTISLTRAFDATDDLCLEEFDDVFAAIKANYGPTDQAPSLKPLETSGGRGKMVASFTARDTSKVTATAYLLLECVINVKYTAASGGASF
ncbi:hypothetical protein [Roseovarius sp. D0-M9]|uniref:hypothetical protein n=1 Tax=Roseovarius sp. D0-M9 TaxID=3127117 RepID=UPI00301035D8